MQVEETVAYARYMADNVPAASLAVIKDQVLRHPYMAADDALQQSNEVRGPAGAWATEPVVLQHSSVQQTH